VVGGRQSIAVYHMRAPLCGHDSTGCTPTGARASQPPVGDDQLKYFRDSSTRRVRQPIKNRPGLARLTRQPTTTHYKDRTAPSLVQFPPPPSNESWGRIPHLQHGAALPQYRVVAHTRFRRRLQLLLRVASPFYTFFFLSLQNLYLYKDTFSTN
jgi:hypothetical protein